MNEIILDDLQLTDSEINHHNLFYKIWLKPRKTLSYITKNCPNLYITELILAAGALNGIQKAVDQSEGPSLFLAILGYGIGAAIGNYLFYLVISNILSWSGGWLKGKANSVQFRTVLAWSLVPSIVVSIITIPLLGIFKSISTDTVQTGGVLAIQFLNIAITLWSMTIFIIGISVIQEFKAGKALLNFLLSMLIIIIPFVIIFLISDLLN